MFITQIFWVLLALIFFFLKNPKKSKMIKYKDNPFHVVAYYVN